MEVYAIIYLFYIFIILCIVCVHELMSGISFGEREISGSMKYIFAFSFSVLDHRGMASSRSKLAKGHNDLRVWWVEGIKLPPPLTHTYTLSVI